MVLLFPAHCTDTIATIGQGKRTLRTRRSLIRLADDGSGTVSITLLRARQSARHATLLMPLSSRQYSVRRLANRAASALGLNDRNLGQSDPDGLRYVTTISVRGHWFISVLCLFELAYRPHYGVTRFVVYALLLSALIAYNGYLHHRLRSGRPPTWHWLLALYGLDMMLVSAGAAVSNGFSHEFFHLFYYPAMAGFAAMFNSLRLNIASVTVVSLIYVGISLMVGDGINLGEQDEKTLLARVGIMYAVVATVNLASRFERMRWQHAAERERALERERVEVSRSIHDTTAQSVFLIGMGIDTAKELAGDGNPELTASLEATSRLSRSTMWELRHPIDVGGIYEGRELGSAVSCERLRQHHVGAGRDDPDGRGAASFRGGQEHALLSGAQRADQRLPPCGGQPCADWPGFRR